MRFSDLSSPISDVLPHIFKRPVLTVSPSDPLLQVATYLAIGPQIYVDGLAVLDGAKPVGRIGGSHFVQYIVQHAHDWPNATASEIMNHAHSTVEASDSLGVALDIFYKTKFAYVPVAVDGRVATSLSLRDTLRLIGDKLTVQAHEISSRLISVDDRTSLMEALNLMLVKGIRNLGIKGEGPVRLINDRKVLEFILSHEGRRGASAPNWLNSVSVGQLDPLYPRCLKHEATACNAAEFLSDISNPCVILPEDRIVTPWDIVMRGIQESGT
jgi:predicted transcriptional regulator